MTAIRCKECSLPGYVRLRDAPSWQAAYDQLLVACEFCDERKHVACWGDHGLVVLPRGYHVCSDCAIGDW